MRAKTQRDYTYNTVSVLVLRCLLSGLRLSNSPAAKEIDKN